jgi:CheY-like chemotaxis protein
MVPLAILHVEDDPDDAFFFARAMRLAKPECQLHLEINGDRAIEYLRKAALANHSISHPIPDVMILDLKLPGFSGFDVLSWTRQQAPFKALPIIVLSGSSLPEDQSRASQLGASEFIVKHSDYGKIAELVIQFMSKNGLPAPRSQ